MSVSRLARLLETHQYRQCLKEAAALLSAGGHDAETEARIHAALCRSCLELGAHHAAVEAGECAVSLAQDSSAADVRGFALADLAAAQAQIRRYPEALAAWESYLELLPEMVAARCREGMVRLAMGDTLRKLGRSEQALGAYEDAHAWFDRFGDEASCRACARASLDLCLERRELARAYPLLLQHAAGLDWARYYLASGDPQRAAAEAFAALDYVDCPAEAQMLLCQAALDQDKAPEALAFALAARVSAMEGQRYDLEFEASEVIFRLLRTHGTDLLDEVAGDYGRQGVNIYAYLSEQALRRCLT